MYAITPGYYLDYTDTYSVKSRFRRSSGREAAAFTLYVGEDYADPRRAAVAWAALRLGFQEAASPGGCVEAQMNGMRLHEGEPGARQLRLPAR